MKRYPTWARNRSFGGASAGLSLLRGCSAPDALCDIRRSGLMDHLPCDSIGPFHLFGMPLALVIDEMLVACGSGGELVENSVLGPPGDGNELAHGHTAGNLRHRRQPPLGVPREEVLLVAVIDVASQLYARAGGCARSSGGRVRAEDSRMLDHDVGCFAGAQGQHAPILVGEI